MFNLPNDWEQITPNDIIRKKPYPASYICKIIRAEIQETSRAKKLILDLDIDDGEFKGFFSDEFNRRKARNADSAWWGLQFSVPINFDEPNHGSFFKQLCKRLAVYLELSNPHFSFTNPDGRVDERRLVGKRIDALIYAVEKESGNRLFTNFRVDSVFTLQAVEEGTCPESWIVGIDGKRRRPDAPPPDTAVEEELDIPF